MALWSNTDDDAGKPKFLSSAEKNATFGVDKTELIVGSDNVVAVSLINGGNRYTQGAGEPTVSGGGGSGAAVSYSGSAAAPAPIVNAFVTNTGSGYTSAPTITFNLPRKTIVRAWVDPDKDSFAYPNHQLIGGEAVKYFHNGGAPIAGLTNNNVYYVSEMGLATSSFRLATSANDATLQSLQAVSIVGTDGNFSCSAAGGVTLQNGDRVQINSVITGDGAITGFTPGKIYKVIDPTNSPAGATAFYLTEEDGTPLVTTVGSLMAFGTGDADVKVATVINLTDLGNNLQYFEIQDETSRATAVAILGTGGTGAAAHAGWVKRTIGYGGRAGRIQTEVLVAMGSMTTDNNDDDTAYPDA